MKYTDRQRQRPSASFLVHIWFACVARAHTANMSASLLSKDEILAHLDKLPYGKRVAYAAELGKQHKGSPELAAWISKMREVRPRSQTFPQSLFYSVCHHGVIFSAKMYSDLVLLPYQHPEPTPPAIEVEEGFSELLPKQKKNIGSCL
jgi:hypothetical protein